MQGKATSDELLAAVKRYAAKRKDQDPTYTKTAFNWLNDEYWKEEQPKPFNVRDYFV